MLIERRTLREQVREELLHRMRSGRVLPGADIDEHQLATELGVSRTPLREALVGLESEGQVTSSSGKGFQFARLSASELEELAPIIARLEGLALELTPPEKRRELGERLMAISREFDQSLTTHSQLTLRDDEWHGILLSACPNRRLLELLEQVRASFHRYEALLVSSDAMIERNASEHGLIAQFLIEDDLPGCQAALATNWANGAARLLAGAATSYVSD